MKLQRPSTIRALLDDLRVRPSRALGQNFLADGNVLRALVAAARLAPGERVLEVGPGLGIVTEALAATGATVVAVEKDRRLAAHLRTYFAGEPRVTVIEGDMLDLDVAAVGGGAFDAVVSNLPYRDGTRILVDVLRAAAPPARMVLTVQKEVADRLAARPATPDYGRLSVWTQWRYDVETLQRVRPRCFVPTPAVDSAIVRLCRHAREPLDPAAATRLFALTNRAFQARRKQLAARLGGAIDLGAWLEAHGLPRTARPEDVPVAAWCEWARIGVDPGGDLR